MPIIFTCLALARFKKFYAPNILPLTIEFGIDIFSKVWWIRYQNKLFDL